MSSITFSINKSGVQQETTGSSGSVMRLVQRTVDEAESLAVQSAPVDKGGLRGSHVKSPIISTGTQVIGGVEAQTDYAMFVHEGTRPHVIVPRRAKVLAWQSNSGVAFAKRVNHPGTKAQPWLAKSAEAAALKNGFTFHRGT